jgi:hypothetical protein
MKGSFLVELSGEVSRLQLECWLDFAHIVVYIVHNMDKGTRSHTSFTIAYKHFRNLDEFMYLFYNTIMDLEALLNPLDLKLRK